jgi:hypothetical protein
MLLSSRIGERMAAVAWPACSNTTTALAAPGWAWAGSICRAQCRWAAAGTKGTTQKNETRNAKNILLSSESKCHKHGDTNISTITSAKGAQYESSIYASRYIADNTRESTRKMQHTHAYLLARKPHMQLRQRDTQQYNPAQPIVAEITEQELIRAARKSIENYEYEVVLVRANPTPPAHDCAASSVVGLQLPTASSRLLVLRTDTRR